MGFRHVTGLVAVFAISAACGGSPKPSDSPGAQVSATPAPVDAGPTTTTTDIPDRGNLAGVKLQPTTTGTPIDGGAPSVASSPEHEPGRSVQDIQTIIMARRDQARACYDASLKSHPAIEGKLDLKWTIDPKGNVTEAAVDDAASDIHEATVAACVVALVKAIHFAESKPDAKWPQGRESHMHYAYDFHPRGRQVTPVPGN